MEEKKEKKENAPLNDELLEEVAGGFRPIKTTFAQLDICKCDNPVPLYEGSHICKTCGLAF